MNQTEKAKHFTALHERGNPVVLFNIWDAGSALVVENAGAQAIATGSHSVAAAHGFNDGEQIPLDSVERNTQEICSAVALPVTIDFEGAYAQSPKEVASNVQRVLNAGAVGINFEDQVVQGDGLYDIDTHCERISAIRDMAESLGVPLFINARTDLFLQAIQNQPHSELLEDAVLRASAYAEAGASGIFVPGLLDEDLIAELCRRTDMPVNVMIVEGAATIGRFAEIGVARISFGPGPYVDTMNHVSERAIAVADYAV